MKRSNVIILGNGPAGLTAGIYAARANLEPLLFAGPQPGGLLIQTSEVENYPGFPDPVNGFELMDRMRIQAEKAGVNIKEVSAERVKLHPGEYHRIVCTDHSEYECHALIIATGASPRWMGLESEQRLRGHGVSACGMCDGPFFRGQTVCVAGGGDTACEEAMFLSRFAEEVNLIHRRNTFRASAVMVDKVMTNPKIRIHTPYQIMDVLGHERVTGVRIRNMELDREDVIPCAALFTAFGHIPNTSMFQGQLALDPAGYIYRENHSSRTSAAGVFAAGDAADPVYRQAVTAAGSGCRAAIDAIHYLEEKLK